jgi:arylsulfatase A-like enzyme
VSRSSTRIVARLLAGLLLAVACAEGAQPDDGTPRHVVLITFDTTRADHFGFMGNNEVATPALDALARESIVLSDLTTAASSTLASHTTLFTGTYPTRHGVLRNGYSVHGENEMLPEILGARGFHTAGFVSAFVMSDRFDFAQGFDHYDQYFDQLIPEGGIEYLQRSAGATTDAAIAYLEEGGVPERLFLFVHYFDPHPPYVAPDEFVARYDPAPIALPADPGEYLRSRSPAGADRATVLQPYAWRYAAQITYLDREVGRLLAHLRETGILDDALLLVTSDHGENFWEHDAEVLFQHHKWVYQTTVHALGLIRLPGGRGGGARLEAPVSHVDLLPTLLAELELEAPEAVQGVALDLRGARETPARPLFGMATGPHWPGGPPRQQNARFVREGRFKLIQTPDAGKEALYDLAADPGETEDLLASPGARAGATADRLREALGAWWEAADPLPATFGGMEKSDTIEKLRSLGYLE